MSDPLPERVDGKPLNLETELARLERASLLDPSTGPEGDLLRALVAILPVGVVVYDVARIHYANACARRLLGVDSTRTSAADVFRHIDPADRPLVEARRDARLRGESTPPLELRMVHADGSRLFVTVETVDLRPAPAAMFLTVIQDVTERRRAEQERQSEDERRQREAEALLETQKLETLGMLTGGIAHDFNNLLANVYASLTALSRLAQGMPTGSMAR